MRKGFLCVLIAFSLSCSHEKTKDLTVYVNPFIGTGGHGHTYPGAVLPFGMIQVSPDTRLDGWDGCSGYHISDSVIFGFSHTHLSGTGCSDYGDILLMPTTGPVCSFNGYPDKISEGYGSGFSHNKEKAEPGYYSVFLSKYNINAELSASFRSAIHRYQYPPGVQRNIILDLRHRDKVTGSELTLLNDHSVSGYRRSEAWATDQICYFHIEFSEPFVKAGIFEEDSLINATTSSSESISAFFSFDPSGNDPVLVRIGISQTSCEEARKNLENEIPDYHFDDIRKNAREIWNQHLGKILAEGDSITLVNFYSALYHSYLAPNLASDVSGTYRGMDKKVHQANHNYYSVFSLWDTYRALHPLMTLIEPEETGNFIRTFLLMYQQGGLLPVWELASNETFCMIGYHAVPVIFDAWMKGIRDYDEKIAFEAMKNSAMQDHLGLSSLKKNGYVAADDEGESVSKTLEYAYDDWCIAMMAKETGKNEDFLLFIERSQAWKHLFDKESGFMRARLNGGWFEPFDPAEVNFNYTEANSWQYSFYVPHDISGLIDLMGGSAAFEARLDSLFSADTRTTGRDQPDITGLIGQYAHGNEPSHHMAYLYNFVAKPYKTQEILSRIMNELYTPQPDGLCGNEDCGQMSAWYVMTAMGFYPVTPGSNQYIIGRPFLKKAVIKAGNAKEFTVTAENLSPENRYIQNVTFNGSPYTLSYITHSMITGGGSLHFVMGSKPSTWGCETASVPVTSVTDPLVVPAPVINAGPRAFRKKAEVSITTACTNCRIYYTLYETGQPDTSGNLYTGPFEVKDNVVIRAIAVDAMNRLSPVTETRLNCIPEHMTITLKSEFNRQYSAGGTLALIDKVRGGTNFRNGLWQGYQGKDVEVIIDLGKSTTLKKAGAGFLQDASPWILYPKNVTFYLSENGKAYTEAGTVSNEVPKDKMGAMIRDFEIDFKPRRARYIKMIASYPGDLPLWHPGAGYPSFIFTDEIYWE